MLLSCHVRVSKWTHALYLPECQGTPCSKQVRYGFLDIQGTIECGFTLKRVRDIRRIYSQMYRKDKYSEHSSIIWPVSLNGWVFVYKLSGSAFESSCIHLNLRIRAWFELRVSLCSGNYSVDLLWNAYMTLQEDTVKCTVQISTQNTAQSFGGFGQMVVCSFTN